MADPVVDAVCEQLMGLSTWAPRKHDVSPDDIDADVEDASDDALRPGPFSEAQTIQPLQGCRPIRSCMMWPTAADDSFDCANNDEYYLGSFSDEGEAFYCTFDFKTGEVRRNGNDFLPPQKPGNTKPRDVVRVLSAVDHPTKDEDVIHFLIEHMSPNEIQYWTVSNKEWTRKESDFQTKDVCGLIYAETPRTFTFLGKNTDLYYVKKPVRTGGRVRVVRVGKTKEYEVGRPGQLIGCQRGKVYFAKQEK